MGKRNNTEPQQTRAADIQHVTKRSSRGWLQVLVSPRHLKQILTSLMGKHLKVNPQCDSRRPHFQKWSHTESTLKNNLGTLNI